MAINSIGSGIAAVANAEVLPGITVLGGAAVLGTILLGAWAIRKAAHAAFGGN